MSSSNAVCTKRSGSKLSAASWDRAPASGDTETVGTRRSASAGGAETGRGRHPGRRRQHSGDDSCRGGIAATRPTAPRRCSAARSFQPERGARQWREKSLPGPSSFDCWNGQARDVGRKRPAKSCMAPCRRHVGGGGTRAPEPDVPIPVLGLVPVPVRRAQVPGLVVEGAAPQHTGDQLADLTQRIIRGSHRMPAI
jgi:hypothetical protein